MADTAAQKAAWKSAYTTIRGNYKTAQSQYKDVTRGLRKELRGASGSRAEELRKQLRANRQYYRTGKGAASDPRIVNTRANIDSSDPTKRYTAVGLRKTDRTKYGYGPGYGQGVGYQNAPVTQNGARYQSAVQFQPPSAQEQRRWGASIGGTGQYASRPLGAPPAPTRMSVWDNGWVERPGNNIWNRRIGPPPRKPPPQRTKP